MIPRRALVAAVAAAVLGAVLLWRVQVPPAPVETAEPRIGGPFALIGPDGPVTDARFRGRWMLVYFGYTNCPDACPTTLNAIAEALTLLPAADRKRLAALFITVDPQRDTPAVMARYTHAFSPDIEGLSGSAGAIADAERAYMVYAAKHPSTGGGYAMDHSSILYVMDPAGRNAGILNDQLGAKAMAARLLRLGV